MFMPTVANSIAELYCPNRPLNWCFHWHSRKFVAAGEEWKYSQVH
jgi:hypothetical protein